MNGTQPDNEERRPHEGTGAQEIGLAAKSDSTALGVSVPWESVPCPIACSPSMCSTPRCSMPWARLEREVLAASEYVDGIEVLR
jgi:hypothetical protein